MSRVLLAGWKPGLKKVSLAKLLQRQAGLSLSQAKDCVDRLLEGKQVFLDVDSQRAHGLVETAEQLGAKGTVLKEAAAS